MDEFLKDIYIGVFRQWVLGQNQENITITENQTDGLDVLTIESLLCYGTITFYPSHIVELAVKNKMTEQTEFYIHFQMNTLSHATSLFKEMIACIARVDAKKSVRVALSCTGGLTTGLFAQELNEAAEKADLNYFFNEVPYPKLYEVGRHYQVILLAPQISYQLARVKEVFKPQLVMNIPPQIFARYDTAALFALLDESLQTKKEDPLPLLENPDFRDLQPGKRKILSVVMLAEAGNTRLVTALWQDQKVIYDKETIKPAISYDDLVAILDVIFVMHPDIEVIGLVLPGIADEQAWLRFSRGKENYDVVNRLEIRYRKKVVLANHANCFAVGCYCAWRDFSSISVFYQDMPGSAGRIGSMQNGHVILGGHGDAGNLDHLYFAQPVSSLALSPEGTLEMVSQILAMLTGILDPEMFVFATDMIHDESILIARMQELLPGVRLPRIVKSRHAKEHMALGAAMLALKELLKK